MKIYKLDHGHSSDGQQGFSYYSSMSKATKAIRGILNDREDGDHNIPPSIEPIEVIQTMTGIIAALNRHGAHNDNG